MQNAIIIGNKTFYTTESYLIGILNITPDSFSDGGRYKTIDQALFRTEEMIAQGAAILDIGGESTRPGYIPISAEEELSRIIPVITAVKSRFDIPISVDTYKSAVAKEAIKSGADLINDIWGLKYDSTMAQVIAQANIPCCLMHNRTDNHYNDFLPDVIADIEDTLTLAEKAGINHDRILLDPGIGFGKTYEQNLLLLKEAHRFKQFDLPLLLGTSRKSVIGLALDLPKDQREEGTIATTLWGRMQGFMFFRVHNVESNYRALKMWEKIKKAGE